MEECKIQNLFDLNQTIAKDIFENAIYPWEVLSKISEFIIELGNTLDPEVFEKKGENYFRRVETEMLEKTCIRTGLVIATGGGVVKKKINYNIIKQNGIVIWIKRDLDKLETDGRPLSLTIPLEQLYAERKDAYAYWSDFYINNNEDRE